MKHPPLGISKISTDLSLSLPKLHQAWAWHHHALSPFMIKYQGTPLDILLVQQDGWNGQNKVGCVCSLSHQRLPFFLSFILSFFLSFFWPPFPFHPLLYEKYVLGKRDGFHSEKEIFSSEKETYIFVSCTWCSCSPPSVSQLSLPPLLFPPDPLFFLPLSLSPSLCCSTSDLCLKD